VCKNASQSDNKLLALLCWQTIICTLSICWRHICLIEAMAHSDILFTGVLYLLTYLLKSTDHMRKQEQLCDKEYHKNIICQFTERQSVCVGTHCGWSGYVKQPLNDMSNDLVISRWLSDVAAFWHLPLSSHQLVTHKNTHTHTDMQGIKLMADGPSILYKKLVRESWYKNSVRVS